MLEQSQRFVTIVAKYGNADGGAQTDFAPQQSERLTNHLQNATGNDMRIFGARDVRNQSGEFVTSQAGDLYVRRCLLILTRHQVGRSYAFAQAGSTCSMVLPILS